MQATMADIFETYIRWVVVCIALLAAKALAGSVALLADSWATALSRA